MGLDTAYTGDVKVNANFAELVIANMVNSNIDAKIAELDTAYTGNRKIAVKNVGMDTAPHTEDVNVNANFAELVIVYMVNPNIDANIVVPDPAKMEETL